MTTRHSRGFSLIELMVVVAIVSIIGAIPIPSLLRSRMSSNEAAAAVALREIAAAQEQFRRTDADGDGEFDYAESLTELATYKLLSPIVADGSDGGYDFALIPEKSVWTVRAAPRGIHRTGDRSFYVDETGVIRARTCAPCNCRYEAGEPFACSADEQCPQRATRHCGVDAPAAPIEGIAESGRDGGSHADAGSLQSTEPRSSHSGESGAAPPGGDSLAATAIGHLAALAAVSPAAVPLAIELASTPEFVDRVLLALDVNGDGLAFDELLEADLADIARMLASQLERKPGGPGAPDEQVLPILKGYLAELRQDLALGVAGERPPKAVTVAPGGADPAALLHLVPGVSPFAEIAALRHGVEMLDARPSPEGDMLGHDVSLNASRWSSLLDDVDALVSAARESSTASREWSKALDRLSANISKDVAPPASDRLLATVKALAPKQP